MYFSIYFSFSKKVFNNYYKVINSFNRVINNWQLLPTVFSVVLWGIAF